MRAGMAPLLHFVIVLVLLLVIDSRQPSDSITSAIIEHELGWTSIPPVDLSLERG